MWLAVRLLVEFTTSDRCSHHTDSCVPKPTAFQLRSEALVRPLQNARAKQTPRLKWVAHRSQNWQPALKARLPKSKTQSRTAFKREYYTASTG